MDGHPGQSSEPLGAPPAALAQHRRCPPEPLAVLPMWPWESPGLSGRQWIALKVHYIVSQKKKMFEVIQVIFVHEQKVNTFLKRKDIQILSGPIIIKINSSTFPPDGTPLLNFGKILKLRKATHFTNGMGARKDF